MRIIEFEQTIDALDYPTTTETITRTYDGQSLDFQDGSEQLAAIFERFGHDSFTSADDLRMTLYGSLPGEAIGRKHYTDRDPPIGDEVEQVSF